jgi:hypothetical protein
MLWRKALLPVLTLIGIEGSVAIYSHCGQGQRQH